ncbi:hypothetical protein FBU30_001392 [Linnemannia zychae]|nr:hypothetical protein FBU30_001392 [Linnemannia zychae]
MDWLQNSNWGRKTGHDDSSPRKRQVDSLLSELPGIRPLPNDNNRFQLTLHLANSSDSPATPHLARTTSAPNSNTNNGRPSSQDSNGNSFSVTSPALSSPTTASSKSNTVTLTVYLPPSFPEEEPKITLYPAVRHLWVDGTVNPCAVTGHERLMPGGWSTHAHLGRIVKEIVTNIQRTGVLVDDNKDVNGNTANHYHLYNNVNNNNIGTSSNQQNNNEGIKVAFDEYSRKPPPPIPGARSKSLGLSKNTSSGLTFTNTNGSQYGNGNSSNNNKMIPKDISTGINSSQTQNRPNVSTTYSSTVTPEVRIIMELSPEKVDELLESQIAFDHFVDHLDTVVNSRTLKQEWWLGNDNVSRRNLALETEMCELKSNVVEGQKTVVQLQKSLEEKLQQQQDALWRFRPETLQSKLRSAAAESEELSESIAQSFLEGKLDQEGFIKQFRDLRKVYHMRTMKYERMGPILRDHVSTSIGGLSSKSNSNNGSGLDMPGSIVAGNGNSGSSSSLIGSTSGPGGTSGGDAWVML